MTHPDRPFAQNPRWFGVVSAIATHDYGVVQTELPMIHSVDGLPLRVNAPPPGVTPRHAAVLVLCRPTVDDIDLVVTRRAGTLRQHSGEIAFPGGRVDDSDADVYACALREAHEEIGIAAQDIRIIGTLHTVYVPRSNHLVTPVVAWLDAPASYTPNPAEVEEVFHLPLERLRRPSALHIEERRVQDDIVRVPYFPYRDHRIWGATALMLCDMTARIDRFLMEQSTGREEQV